MLTEEQREMARDLYDIERAIIAARRREIKTTWIASVVSIVGLIVTMILTFTPLADENHTQLAIGSILLFFGWVTSDLIRRRCHDRIDNAYAVHDAFVRMIIEYNRHEGKLSMNQRIEIAYRLAETQIIIEQGKRRYNL